MLRERLATHLQALTASQRTAQSGATHEEARQEHPKDTRAIEAQYLARGLADRVETLRSAVVTLGALRLVTFGADDEVGLSALVEVEDDAGAGAVYFLFRPGVGRRWRSKSRPCSRSLRDRRWAAPWQENGSGTTSWSFCPGGGWG